MRRIIGEYLNVSSRGVFFLHRYSSRLGQGQYVRNCGQWVVTIEHTASREPVTVRAAFVACVTTVMAFAV